MSDEEEILFDDIYEVIDDGLDDDDQFLTMMMMEVLFPVSRGTVDPLCPNYITPAPTYRFDLMLL